MKIKNDEGILSRNQKLLASFSEYCLANPNERFYQALRNWSGNRFILKADGLDFDTGKYTGIKDTFYDEN